MALRVADGEDLLERLMALRAEANEPPSREEILAIVESVVDSMRGDFTSADLKLFHELESLVSYIQSAKSEILALRPDRISSEHIPSATDELDAIVTATEDATNSIMAAAETVEEVAATLEGEAAEKLVEVVTTIYEACSFQDITGQRISKVVNTLQRIEGWVSELVEAFGAELGEAAARPAPDDKEVADEHAKLMNGPQLEGKGRSQAEVDALLASFD